MVTPGFLRRVMGLGGLADGLALTVACACVGTVAGGIAAATFASGAPAHAAGRDDPPEHARAIGQAAPPAQPEAQASEPLRMAGSIELARLVDLAAARLKVRIEYDPELVSTAAVTLRSETTVTDAELWGLLNQLLAGRGFTTVRPPGAGAALRVVKREQAADAARVDDPAGPETNPAAAAGFVSVLYRTTHISGRAVVDAVKPLLSKQGGSASAIGDSGLVVVSDLASTVAQALTVARLLDAPSGQVRVESVPLRNVAAAPAAMLVAQLVAKRDAVAGASGAGGGGAATPGSGGWTGRVPGDVLAGPDGSSLLIVAPEDRMAFWRGLIAQIDQAEPVFTQTYLPGAFAVHEVLPLLNSVLASQRGGGPSGGPGSAAGGRAATVVSDALTGSLLITGTQDQHELVEQTLARLAEAPAGARRPLKAFVLKHRSVREVIGIVDRLIDIGILDSAAADGDAGATGGPAEAGDSSGPVRVPPPPASSPKPPTATVAVEPKDSPLLNGMTRGSKGGVTRSGSPDRLLGRSDSLTLTADEATNTLIAIGDPRVLAQLEKLLPMLDARQSQVMIEAVLVSLTDSQTMQLGVELEKIELSGGTLIRLSSLFGLSTAGTGANAGSRVVGDAAGFSGVVLNPGDFSVIIRALETVNQGRSLSVPKVLVNNNQQATFNSTLQQPFASTNASDTVATTSFGGTFDAGTIITVRPQIAEGDHLVLDYQVKLSSFTGSATASLPPPRQENSITSIATIPDGYTVVVGGLEAITDGEGESRIPGLGAIPILGELFKNRTNQRSRARFFVFLRANVMRGASGTGFEELKYLSDRSAGEAGLTSGQSAGGWPELAPRVIR